MYGLVLEGGSMHRKICNCKHCNRDGPGDRRPDEYHGEESFSSIYLLHHEIVCPTVDDRVSDFDTVHCIHGYGT